MSGERVHNYRTARTDISFKIDRLNEEKTNLTKKLEDACFEISILKKKCDKQNDDIAHNLEKLSESETEIANLKNKDDLKQRKIDGLLKIVQQKTSELDSLKSSTPRPPQIATNDTIRGLMEFLEKELNIYKNLNKSKTDK